MRSASETEHFPLLSRTQYSITHHRVTLHVHTALRVTAAEGEVWQPLAMLEALPMPAPFRKVVRIIGGAAASLPPAAVAANGNSAMANPPR